jgi:hypothetical protein
MQTHQSQRAVLWISYHDIGGRDTRFWPDDCERSGREMVALIKRFRKSSGRLQRWALRDRALM